MDRLNGQVRLREGRKLGYAEHGDPRGKPVLYFHGWPGSRLEPRALASFVGPLQPRVLALDRPGYGLSDFQPRRTLLDWPKDVEEFADHLRLESFGVLGMSGGGPYAAVCAAKLRHRVSKLILVCAMGPLKDGFATHGMEKLNRWMLSLARTAPQIARVVVGFGLERMRHKPERMLSQLEGRLAECDRRVLAQPEFRKLLLESFAEGLRPGVGGATWDGGLYAQPWGFSLEEVRAPTELWHGEADVVVPLIMARIYAKAIPQCRAHLLPGEGHFSLPFHHCGDILAPAPPQD